MHVVALVFLHHQHVGTVQVRHQAHALLRQRFSWDDWNTAPRLVGDLKVDLRRRRFPRRDVDPSEILAALQAALGEQPALRVQAQGLGAFPNLKRPRVLWVGLSGEGFKELSEAVETALMPLDFPPEEREFTPHLTLGRVRSLRGWERVLAAVKEYEHVRFGESTVHQVTLYQSELRPDGAVYSPLGSVPLRQSETL